MHLDMNQIDQKYRYLSLFVVGIFPFLINGSINPLIAQIPTLYWSFELVIWVAMPCLIFYLLVTNHGLKMRDIGFVNPFTSTKTAMKFIGVCLFVMIFDSFIYKQAFYFFYSIAPAEPMFAYQSIIPESGTKRLIVIWYLAISAGVVEELYFRGLLHKISNLFGSPWVLYLFFSPLFFSVIHWEGNLASMGASYVVGLFGCLLYLWLRNIWPLIIGHIYTDLLWFQ